MYGDEYMEACSFECVLGAYLLNKSDLCAGFFIGEIGIEAVQPVPKGAGCTLDLKDARVGCDEGHAVGC
jgi:hypothetical protein